MGVLPHTGDLEQIQHHTVVFVSALPRPCQWKLIQGEGTGRHYPAPFVFRFSFVPQAAFWIGIHPLREVSSSCRLAFRTALPWETSKHSNKYIGVAKQEFPKTFDGATQKPSASGSAPSEFLPLLSSARTPDTWCSACCCVIRDAGCGATLPAEPRRGAVARGTASRHSPRQPPSEGEACDPFLFFFFITMETEQSKG